jgi:peptidoglycan hydrolase-like protein with peptidoglycan-binding domain
MNFTELYQKIRTLDEAGGDISQGPMANSNSSRPTKGKAIDPVRDAPVDVQKQKVKPQANRPGLAPGGDPKLWDIQHELQKRGYKIKPDGLNGPATQKAVEMAQRNHNWIQDTEHPSAVSIGSKIGSTLGDISAWVETTWRNLKASYKYATYDQDIPYNENFTRLYKKIAEMDGSGMIPHDSTSAINGDEDLEECGPMGPSGMMGMRGPEQQDSISANISMNASGKGGIRDLMMILQNLESGSGQEEMPHPDELELDIKGMDHPHDHTQKHGEEDNIIFGNDVEEEYANEPDEMYAPVSAVTPTGNDMHSKGEERPKVNGGGNPYAVTAEGLQRQLQNLYKEVKSR